ncbi:mRNA-decapping enzyme subunit 2 [Puccinia graminis f. sp. tritici]|uniref:mRNA-decapping enzyme subunit 2 n=1 Tax=Puccinia graminis f. sp. tritici TaxID=56615 RepID=A0A5B0PFR5_PUCGR|nr:mRNA-decapping enzyme subunit 2 [Puccinia graminis f. sp. tritici]
MNLTYLPICGEESWFSSKSSLYLYGEHPWDREQQVRSITAVTSTIHSRAELSLSIGESRVPRGPPRPSQTPSPSRMPLEDVLEDLASRFILNLPIVELSHIERVCFQVEQAHWFYKDFVMPNSLLNLPSYHLKTVTGLFFKKCDLLTVDEAPLAGRDPCASTHSSKITFVPPIKSHCHLHACKIGSSLTINIWTFSDMRTWLTNNHLLVPIGQSLPTPREHRQAYVQTNHPSTNQTYGGNHIGHPQSHHTQFENKAAAGSERVSRLQAFDFFPEEPSSTEQGNQDN